MAHIERVSIEIKHLNYPEIRKSGQPSPKGKEMLLDIFVSSDSQQTGGALINRVLLEIESKLKETFGTVEIQIKNKD